MATYYVSPSVSSGGNGSESNPWPLSTVLPTTAPLNPGDEVLFLPGNYSGNVSFQKGGNAAAKITYRPKPGTKCRFIGNWPSGDVVILKGNYIRFRSNDYDSRIEITTSVTGSQRDTASGSAISITGDFSEAWGIFAWDTDGGCAALQAGSGATYLRFIGWKLGTDFFVTPGTEPESGTGAGNYPTYIQNPSGVGNKIIEQCFWQYFQGRFSPLHVYGSSAEISNIKIRGCTSINKGNGSHLGSFNKPADGLEISDCWFEGDWNWGYGTGGDGAGGRNRGELTDNFLWNREFPNNRAILNWVSAWGPLAIENNIFYCAGAYDYERTAPTERQRLIALDSLTSSTGVAWTNNKFYSPLTTAFRTKGPSPSNLSFANWLSYITGTLGWTQSGNTFSTGVPADVVQVLASADFPDWWIVRARNFTAGADDVTLEHADCPLTVGDSWKLISLEDPLGAPLSTGVYDGNGITLPMDNTAFAGQPAAYNDARPFTKNPKQLQYFSLVRTEAAEPTSHVDHGVWS